MASSSPMETDSCKTPVSEIRKEEDAPWLAAADPQSVRAELQKRGFVELVPSRSVCCTKMARGGVVVNNGGRVELYKGRTTAYVILACIVAAIGGLIFGYDIRISGGVTSMDDFLEKFFPVVEQKKDKTTGGDSDYCMYNNQGLMACTSSLYLTGLVVSFATSHVTKRYGRRPSIILGGFLKRLSGGWL